MEAASNEGPQSSSAILEKSMVYAEVIICNTDREPLFSYIDSICEDQELETDFANLVFKIRPFEIS